MILERNSNQLAEIVKKREKGFSLTTVLKPFDPLPILPSKYGRVTAVDLRRRYDANANLEEILQDVEYVILRGNGQFNIQEKSADGFVLDASDLQPSNVDYCMYQLENHMNRIYGVTFFRSKSVTFNFDKILSEILVRDRLQYLVELNVSYLTLSQYSIDALCTYANPVSAGYCPLRRVIATRCSLGTKEITFISFNVYTNVLIHAHLSIYIYINEYVCIYT